MVLQGNFPLRFSRPLVTFPETLYYLQQSVLITAFPVACVLTRLGGVLSQQEVISSARWEVPAL